MNKAELIEAIAKSADLSKASATRALEGTLSAITASLKRGRSVSLAGFGTFEVESGAARSDRGTPAARALAPAAARMPKFKPGKALRDAIR
jgi:nucleoid DNA-binding protein